MRGCNLRDIKVGREPQLEGHKGPVTSVNFSSDGKRIVSGSRDGTVKIWDSKNGTLIHSL